MKVSSSVHDGSYANINLKNGPIKERSCTDILCAIIFCAFFVTSIAVYAYGFKKGDPN